MVHIKAILLAFSLAVLGFSDVACTSPPSNFPTQSPTSFPAVLLSKASISVREGSADTYTVQLHSEPSATVTISISVSSPTHVSVSTESVAIAPGDWNAPVSITVTSVGNDVHVTGPTAYTITHTVASSDPYYQDTAILPDPTMSFSVYNDDEPGVVFSASSLSVTESGSVATYTVMLTSEPSAEVTIDAAATGGNAALLQVSPASYTFNGTDWNLPKEFTVSAPDDELFTDMVTTVPIGHSITSTDTFYSGLTSAGFVPAQTISTLVYDDDSPAVLITVPTSTEGKPKVVEAGSTYTYNIKLGSRPSTGTVTVAIAVGDSSLVQISPSSVEFSTTDWNINKPITVQAVVSDIAHTDPTDVSLTHSATAADTHYNGLATAAFSPSHVVTIARYDAESPSIVLSRTRGSVQEGTTALQYTIVLSSEPTADVVVTPTITTGNGLVQVTPTSRTIQPGDWNVPVSFEVSAVDDDVWTAYSSAVVITHTSTSSDDNYVSATNDNLLVPSDILSITRYDNDEIGIQFSATKLSVSEAGASRTYSFGLLSEPLDDVVVTLSLTNDNIGTLSVSPLSVTVLAANWDSPNVITVSMPDDDTRVAAESTAEIVHTAASSGDAAYNGLASTMFFPSDTVLVTAVDNDLHGVLVSKVGLTIGEGGAGVTYTIELLSEPLNPVTITVTPSRSDLVSVFPDAYVFDSTNWNVPKTASVTAVDDTLFSGTTTTTLTHTSSSSDTRYDALASESFLPVNQITVTRYDDDSVGIVISTAAVSLTEGGASVVYSVVLTTEPTDDVVVSVVSSDPSLVAAVPTSLTFLVGDWNVAQDVSLTSPDDQLDSGALSTVTVQHTASSSGDLVYNNLASDKFSPSNTVSVQRYDNDVKVVILSTGQLFVEEGNSDTYTVVLGTAPENDHDVTITISENGGNSGLVVISPNVLTFNASDWSDAQTVTVVSVADSIDSGAEYSVTLDHAAASSDPSYDSTNVAFEPISGQLVFTMYDNYVICRRPCSAGSYSVVANNLATCEACPRGYFCEGDCESPTPCAAGSSNPNLSGADISACIACDSGEYAATIGSVECSTCPVGYACFDPELIPVICAAGSAAPLGSVNCMDCLTGEYSDSDGRGECLTCPDGYECSDKSVSPVRCASGEYSNANRIQCDSCPAGFSCMTPSLSPQVCTPGTYSKVNWAYCVACPAGHDCTDPAIDPVECALGTMSLGGTSACEACAVGRYTENAGAAYCSICPAGHSCLYAVDLPVECDAGTYASYGSGVCTTCGTGTYSGSAAQQCTPCTAGHKCVDPAVSPVGCTQGYYSSAGASSCSACNTGTQSSPVLLGTRCVACEIGYECGDPTVDPVPCVEGSYGNMDATAGNVPRCTLCDAGYFCPDGTSGPQTCPRGTYSAVNATTCTDCDAGYECLDISATPVACDTGYYSAVGDATCRPCEAGYSCQDSALDPVPCTVGTYSLAKATECISCAAGTACPPPYSAKIMCPTGTYSLLGDASCTPCGAGLWCASADVAPQTCPDGTYSTGGETACHQCPAGYQCINKAALPVECTPGSFSVSGQIDCTVCPAGYACPSTTVGTQDLCPSGTYAEAGADQCAACPAGNECPDHETATIVPCADGYYSVGSQASCTQCEAGKECQDRLGLVILTCMPGYFSTGGSSTCQVCPAGMKCPDNDVAPTLSCADGTWSIAGQTVCNDCPAGKECPDTDSNSAQICGLGSFSLANAASCTPCPAGYSCPTTTTTPTIVCGTGTYSVAGQALCLRCPAGYMCDDPAEMPVPCDPGYYSLGSADSCEACPAGSQCSSTATVPQQCGEGTYSLALAISCSPCDPGYWCGAGSVTSTPAADKCAEGGWCNPPTAYTDCSAGSYGTKIGGFSQADACASCPAGSFCLQGSTLSSMLPCAPGYYCPQSTTQATQYACEAGTYNPDPGALSDADCLDCDAGFYCPIASDKKNVCPSGYFCPANTGNYLSFPCPAGTYSGGTTGMVDSSTCQPCPIGSYCVPGSQQPVKCAAGWYNPSPSGNSSSTCLPCEAGWACPVSGMSEMLTPCQAGHYCPAGTVNQDDELCPAGSYTDATNLVKLEDCTPCPERFSCAAGSTSSTFSACTAGNYCQESTPTPTSYPCSAGSYSTSTTLASDNECTDCPPGSYCVGGLTKLGSLSDTVGNCAAGHYCPIRTKLANEFKCPAGTYSSSVSLEAIDECIPCPKGHFCLEASTEPDECLAGTYSNLNNTESVGPGVWPACASCIAGYKCPIGSAEPIECGKGYFSAANAGECTECQVGHYCDSITTTQTNMLTNKRCPAGMFCDEGMAVPPDTASFSCPTGQYCEEATTMPTDCLPGTYNPNMGGQSVADCLTCEAGWYCGTKSSALTGKCEPGYFCEDGSTGPQQSECPARTYRSISGARDSTECSVCTTGHYCPTGTANPIICEEGHYCVSGVSMPEPCPSGTYSDSEGLRTLDGCTLCLPGQYCDTPGQTLPTGPCDPGYYCLEGSHTSAPLAADSGSYPIGGKCPRGGYCPQGSSKATSCPPGRYNNVTGASTSGECISCDPGYYCAGSDNPYPTSVCDAGYYCDGGASAPNQHSAPPGYYTLEGAQTPVPCGLGMYNPSSEQSECKDCIAGFYCGNVTTIQVASCPEGSYCPAKTSVPVRCPPGTFSNAEQLTNATECTQCSPGSYCASNGLTQPTAKCAAGYFCLEGSVKPNPLAETYGSRCPEGYYCIEGTHTPQACPAGTYNPSTTATQLIDCLDCPLSQFCNETGLTAPSGDCSAGFYCTGGAKSSKPSSGSASGDVCSRGMFCPEGSSSETPCLPGTYAPDEGRGECLSCPAGYFCDGSDPTTFQICSQGSFCPESTDASLVPCPIGTYGDRQGLENITQCHICDAGSYCDSTQLIEPTGPCDPGYYCPQGSTNAIGALPSEGITEHVCSVGSFCEIESSYPEQCMQGTFSNQTGNEKPEDCVECLDGYYCEGTGLSKPTGPCAKGYYCKRGSTTARPSNGTDVDVDTGLNMGGDVCPAGSFCLEGSSDPEPCPAGTYNPSTGEGIACLDCPPGFFCIQGSTNYLTQICPKGFYCEQGTEFSTQFPCPAGTYSDNTQRQQLSDCQCSPPGTFTSSTGNSMHGPDCDTGFFCSGCATTGQPTDGITGNVCGSGSYCPQGSSAAVQCTGGSYCTDSSATPAGECNAGYFCIQGSWTPTPNGQTNSEGSIGDICLPGHYCPEGSNDVTACPPGTFAKSTGNPDSSYCLTCTAGYYCPNAGTVTPLECLPGYVCDGGDITPATLCNRGYQCPNGTSSQVPCDAGTYQNTQGQDSCDPCPSSYYCEEAATTPIDCPAGYYCEGGNRSPFETACPKGTFSNVTNLDNVLDCMNCLPGYYCPLDGQTAPAGLCESGHFCRGGSATPTPDMLFREGYWGLIARLNYSALTAEGLGWSNSSKLLGDVCPPAHFCIQGSSAPEPCPVGTFSSSYGLESVNECQPCEPGFFCPLSGQTEPVDICQPGYYCPGGDVQSTLLCTKGHYCAGGNTSPKPCTARTYQAETGRQECDPCPESFYCEAVTVDPVPCVEGHYCVAQTAYSTEFPCPPGTFSNDLQLRSASECAKCTSGAYCESSGLISPTGNCSAGHFCSGGATIPDPDDGGVTGGLCDEGWVCTGGARSSIPDSTTGYACPKGHYCPQGASNEIACEPGTFSSALGASVCEQCTERNYCPGTTVDPLPCREFMYCPPGSSIGEYCPGGRHGTNLTMLQSADECEVCPPGQYCTGGKISGQTSPGYLCYGGCDSPTPQCESLSLCGGNDDSSLFALAMCPYGSKCLPGHYCPLGTSVPIMCANGTVRVEAGGMQQSDCGRCEPGFLCVDGDPTPRSCPQGHYCPDGLAIQCPMYTYQPAYGAAALTDCRPCGAGHLCDEVAITFQSDHMCPPGFYCPEQSTEALPCPAGSFRPSPGAQGLEECYTCPEGFYCPRNATSLVSNATNASGEQCTNFGSITPFMCDVGSFCPAGASNPTLCPLGYAASITSDPRSSIENACTICSPGTFGAHPQRLECAPSAPGFVCLQGCKAEKPGDLARDNGYVCPVGHYCPMGSTRELTCGIGEFNKARGSSNVTACELCAPGTYGDRVGQGGCKPCSSSSSSEAGSTICKCIGLHRAFQPFDGKCLCEPGYEFFSSSTGFVAKAEANDDGIENCQPITYSRCASGESLSSNGVCVDAKEQCGNECAFTEAGSGLLNTRTGMCECDGLTLLENVCDTACQKNVTSGVSSSLDGENILTLSGGVTVDLEATVKMSGTLTCSEEDIKTRDGCKAISCRVDANLGVICSYDMLEGLPSLAAALESTLPGGTRRRLQQMRKRNQYFHTFDVQQSDMDRLMEEDDDGLFEEDDDTDGEYDRDYTLSNNLHDYGAHGGVSGSPEALDDLAERLEHRARGGSFGRRLAEAGGTGFAQPIICISQGDGMLFDVGNGGTNSTTSTARFPVYKKDSLLNTNPNFDFGEFRRLAEVARSSSAGEIDVFAFTFQESGIYVFGMNENLDFETIVTVQVAGQVCSTDGAIVPKSSSALVAIGAKKSEGIILEPDWTLIGGLMGGLFGMVIFVVGVLYTLRRAAWNNDQPKGKPSYRKKGNKLNIEAFDQKGSKWDIKKATVGGDKNDNEAEIIENDGAKRGRAGLFHKSNKVAPEQLVSKLSKVGGELGDSFRDMDLDRWDEEDFDPRELVERLMHHHDSVKGRITHQEDMIDKLTNLLEDETKDLKQLLSVVHGQSVVGNEGSQKRAHLAEVTEVSEHVKANKISARRLGRLEEEFLQMAQEIADSLDQPERGVEELAFRVADELSVSINQLSDAQVSNTKTEGKEQVALGTANVNNLGDSDVAQELRTAVEKLVMKGDLLADAYRSEADRRRGTPLLDAPLTKVNALGATLAEALQELRDSDGTVEMAQVCAEVESFAEQLRPFPEEEFSCQEHFLEELEDLKPKNGRALNDVEFSRVRKQFVVQLTSQLSSVQNVLKTLLGNMPKTIEELDGQRESVEYQGSGILSMVSLRQGELERELARMPVHGQGQGHHAHVAFDEDGMSEVMGDMEFPGTLSLEREEEWKRIEERERVAAAILDMDDDTPMDQVHANEAEALELTLAEEEAEELKKWNQNLETEKQRLAAEEEEFKNEQLAQIEGELGDQEDLSEEDRGRIMAQLEADHSKMSTTLDMEHRRQQEELKNRLAERKVRRRRNQNKRHKNEVKEEQMLQKQEEQEATLAAEQFEMLTMTEQFEDQRLLGLVEEEELRAELEVEVKIMEMSATNAAMAAASLAVEDEMEEETGVDKEAAKAAKQEGKSVLAKFRIAKDRIRVKLEEDRVETQKKADAATRERRNAQLAKNFQVDPGGANNEMLVELRTVFQTLVDEDHKKREDLEAELGKLEQDELVTVQDELRGNLQKAAKLATARGQNPVQATSAVIAEQKAKMNALQKSSRQRRESKHRQVLEETMKKREVATAALNDKHHARLTAGGTDADDITSQLAVLSRALAREQQQDKLSLEAQLAERSVMEERRRLQQERELARVEAEEAAELEKLAALRTGKNAAEHVAQIKEEALKQVEALKVTMEQEKDRRRAAVKLRMEKLKKERMEQVAKDQAEEKERLKEQHKAEAMEIQEEIEDDMDEEWEEVVEQISEEQGGDDQTAGDSPESAEEIRKAEEEHQQELERLRAAQEAERKRLEEQIENERQELLKRADFEEENERLRVLEEQRKAAMEKETTAKTQDEIAAIREAHERELEAVNGNLAQKRTKQREKLLRRLEAKKAQEAKRLRKKQSEESDVLNETAETSKMEVQTKRAKAAEERAIEAAIKSGAVSEERMGDAIEKVLSKRHNNETQVMMQKQYKERTQKLKGAMEEVFQRRKDARSALAAELKSKQALEEEVNKALADLEQEFEELQNQAEKKLLADLDEIQGQQQIELRQRQMAEVNEALKNRASSDALDRHKQEQARRQQEELEEYKARMKIDRAQRIERIQVDKLKFEENLKQKSKQDMLDWEAEQKTRLESERKQAFLGMQKRQKVLLQEQDKLHEQRLESLGSDAPEEKKKELVDQFEANKKRVVQALLDEKEGQDKQLDQRLTNLRTKVKVQNEQELAEKLRVNEVAAKREIEMVEISLRNALNRKEQLANTILSSWIPPRPNEDKATSRSRLAASKWKRKSVANSIENMDAKDRREARKKKVIERMQGSASVGELGQIRRGSRDTNVSAREAFLLAQGTSFSSKFGAQMSTVDGGGGGSMNAMQEQKLHNRLGNIEKLLTILQDKQGDLSRGGPSVGKLGAPADAQRFVDSIDAAFKREGSLVVVPESNLGASQRKHLLFGRRVVSAMGMDQIVNLQVASQLPALPEALESNAFRNSIHWDMSQRVLFVRLDRLKSVGDMTAMLVHTLAHIKTNPADLSDDTSAVFATEFHRGLSVVGSALFDGAMSPTETVAARATLEPSLLRAIVQASDIDESTESDNKSKGLANRIGQYNAFSSRQNVMQFLATLDQDAGSRRPSVFVEEDSPLETRGSENFEQSLKQNIKMFEDRVALCTKKAEEMATEMALAQAQLVEEDRNENGNSGKNRIQATIDALVRSSESNAAKMVSYVKELEEKRAQLTMYMERSGSMRKLISETGVKTRLEEIKGE